MPHGPAELRRLSATGDTVDGVMMTTVARTMHGRAARIKKSAIHSYGTMRSVVPRARARRKTTEPGITVVTVNWNTLPFLRIFLETVKARSPVGTRIIVVDNGSNDGSHEFLQGCADIETILLKINIRHGRALDLAVAQVKTETVVVLDIDAFPISDTWLVGSLEALENGKVLSGAYFHRNYIHPCFLVARRDTLVMNDLSFRPIGSTGRSDGTGPFQLFMDVGESISQAVIVKYGSESLHRIGTSEIQGPGMCGSVFGDVVYHNFETTYGPRRSGALERFNEAVERFNVNSQQRQSG